MGRPRLKQFAQSGATDDQVATYDSASGQWGPEDPQGEDVILTCDTGVAVRDLVYIDGTGTADKADATDNTTAPAVGLVTEKPTSSTCKVVSFGLVSGFTGLTIGALYLSETAGSTTSTAPTGAGKIFQPVGRAVSTTQMLVQIGTPVERGT